MAIAVTDGRSKLPNWNRDKATFELTAEKAGTLTTVCQGRAITLAIGATVCHY